MSITNSPTTINVNSNPFFTDLRWTWLGRLANPTYPGVSGLVNWPCCRRTRRAQRHTSKNIVIMFGDIKSSDEILHIIITSAEHCSANILTNYRCWIRDHWGDICSWTTGYLGRETETSLPSVCKRPSTNHSSVYGYLLQTATQPTLWLCYTMLNSITDVPAPWFRLLVLKPYRSVLFINPPFSKGHDW